MIKFKKLFQFSKHEISKYFEKATFKAKINGLKLLQNTKEELEFGKLLIIIPRKAGKASKRNFIRRRIKAIFYEKQLYKKPIISILIVYKQAMDLKFNQLKEFLTKNI